ncbi:MAG: hypothetical protein HKN23_12670 [Verrucomicrobiales bacterium]|nr:hypothetical protein [Verrucomicrobiales bacterium]
MTQRLNFIADPELSAMRGQLEECLEGWVEGLDPNGFSALFDPLMQDELKRSFKSVGGSEGTVWLADQAGENLVAVFNSGPNADELTGFKQPLGKGIISLVFSHERPYCENEIGSCVEDHDDTLDRKIGTQTSAMIAVPFYFAYGLRGVVSCVKLGENGDCDGFDSAHVDELAAAASVVERLIDCRLITAALGLDDA